MTDRREPDDLLDTIHTRMISALPDDDERPGLAEFYRLLRTYPSRRGKMLRGRLVVEAADAFAGDRDLAVDVAAALELFQNWVLVHDDIEDDSLERRGEPALHRLVGMPLALNVGDALHVYMWDLLHGLPTDAEHADRLRREFLTMIHRTAEGQHLDLVWVAHRRFDIAEEDYLRMVVLKTAWYTVTTPLRLGARIGGATPPASFDVAGADLGAAFQIRDDVLNLQPVGDGYGKEHAGDLYEGKRTLILAHLFSHASHDVRDELERRLAAPREGRTEDDVAWILARIHEHGSLQYAQERAEALASTGLEALEEGLDEAQRPAAAQRIVHLMRTLTARTF